MPAGAEAKERGEEQKEATSSSEGMYIFLEALLACIASYGTFEGFFKRMSGIAKAISGSYKHYHYTPVLPFKTLTIEECREIDKDFDEKNWDEASQLYKDDMTRIIRPGIRTNYL
jgi:hypothetical protein